LPHFFRDFLDFVNDLLDDLLDLADRLIDLTLRTKLIVVGQRADGFLQSTFHYVCLATHDGDPMLEVGGKRERKKTDAIKHLLVFDRIGLLVNRPSSYPGVPFI